MKYLLVLLLLPIAAHAQWVWSRIPTQIPNTTQFPPATKCAVIIGTDFDFKQQKFPMVTTRLHSVPLLGGRLYNSNASGTQTSHELALQDTVLVWRLVTDTTNTSTVMGVVMGDNKVWNMKLQLIEANFVLDYSDGTEGHIVERKTPLKYLLQDFQPLPKGWLVFDTMPF